MGDYIFWLLVIAYAAHMMEEYILNWKSWVFVSFNREITWGEFIITNAVVIIAGVSFAMIGFKNPYITMIYPSLMIINAIVFHIVPTIIKKKFSPGLITSITLFLPLSAVTFYEAYKLNFLDVQLIFASIVGGIIIMLYPISLQLLKKYIRF